MPFCSFFVLRRSYSEFFFCFCSVGPEFSFAAVTEYRLLQALEYFYKTTQLLKTLSSSDGDTTSAYSPCTKVISLPFALVATYSLQFVPSVFVAI